MWKELHYPAERFHLFGFVGIVQPLRVSEAEILSVLANARDDDDEQAIIMRIRGRASPEKIAELRAKLKEWLDSVTNCDESAAADDAEDFGGLIAFYRID